MKIRVTIMTENDKHVDVEKEEIERKAKDGWQLYFNMVSLYSDDREKAIVEKCEVVEM